MSALALIKNEEIEKIENDTNDVCTKANALVISDDATYEIAGEFFVTVKKLTKEVKSTFDPIVNKARETWDEANKQRRRHLQPLVDAENTVKAKLAAYKRKQDELRAEEERKRRIEAHNEAEARRLDEAEAAQKLGQKEHAEHLLNTPVQSAPVNVAPSTPKVAGMTMRKVWKARVINAALVPEDYKIVDEKALNGLARSLKERANVPGVEFYCEETPTGARS